MCCAGEDEGRLSFEGASIYSKLQKGLFLDVGGGDTKKSFLFKTVKCIMYIVFPVVL